MALPAWGSPPCKQAPGASSPKNCSSTLPNTQKLSAAKSLGARRLGSPTAQPRCGLRKSRQSLPPRPLTQGGGLKGCVLKGLVRVANKTSWETARTVDFLRGSWSPPTNSKQLPFSFLPPTPRLPPPAGATGHHKGPQCFDYRLQDLGAAGCLHA